MKHGYKQAKLGRKSSHRMPMLKNMVISILSSSNGIESTLPNLKALRPFFERLITKARIKDGKNSLHVRRVLLSKLFNNEKAVSQLMELANTKFSERNGGYTRIFKIGSRPGDKANVGLMQFVD